MEWPCVVRGIDNEAHAVVADDLLGWRSDRPEIALRNNRTRTILWERALIKPVGNRKPRSPIVFVPVVFRNVGVGGGPVQANCESCGGGGLQEPASVYLCSLNGEVNRLMLVQLSAVYWGESLNAVEKRR